MNKLFSFLFGKQNLQEEPQKKPSQYDGISAYEKAQKIFYDQNIKDRNDEEALLLFDIAIENGVNAAHADRAFCLQALRFEFDAISDFNKAILNSKYDANLYFGRGHSKSSVADFDGAISDLKMAIELSKIDSELNQIYSDKIKEDGWGSVTQLYESALNQTLAHKLSSEKEHMKEYYLLRTEKIERRKL